MAYDFMAEMSAKIKNKNNPMSAFDVPNMNSQASAAVTQSNAEQAAPASVETVNQFYGPGYRANPYTAGEWGGLNKPIEQPGTPDAVNLQRVKGGLGAELYPTNDVPQGDAKDMSFTPEGFRLPGDLDHSFTGARDVLGRQMGEQGVVANGIPQKQNPADADSEDSYAGPSNAGNDAQSYADSSIAKQKSSEVSKPNSYNPLMQSTFGYQTGNAPDQNGYGIYTEPDPSYVKDKEISSSRLKSALDGVTGAGSSYSGAASSNSYLQGAEGVNTSMNLRGNSLNEGNFNGNLEGFSGNEYTSGADGIDTGIAGKGGTTNSSYFTGNAAASTPSPFEIGVQTAGSSNISGIGAAAGSKVDSRINAIGVKQKGTDFKYQNSGITTGMETGGSSGVNTSINTPETKPENDQAIIDFNTKFSTGFQPGQFPSINQSFSL